MLSHEIKHYHSWKPVMSNNKATASLDCNSGQHWMPCCTWHHKLIHIGRIGIRISAVATAAIPNKAVKDQKTALFFKVMVKSRSTTGTGSKTTQKGLINNDRSFGVGTCSALFRVENACRQKAKCYENPLTS